MYQYPLNVKFWNTSIEHYISSNNNIADVANKNE